MRTSPAIEQALRIAIERGERAVQVAAWRNGRLIVDAAAGSLADGTPATTDTLFPILSASKAVAAVAIHHQAARGLLDIDAPIAAVWPEFAAKGKAAITTRDVLSHRAGMAHLPPGTDLAAMLDARAMADSIARLAPWPTGPRNAYHALSGGFILGEIVRRTDPAHRPFGQFVQAEICAPLGIDDLWIGLPADRAARCADVVAESWPLADPGSQPLRAAAVPPALGTPDRFQNDPAFRAACVPAGNGIANARSLSRLFALLAGGGLLAGRRWFDAAQVRDWLTPRPDDELPDAVLGRPGGFGIGGFQTAIHPVRGGPDPVVGQGAVLWNFGGGGTYAWADLDGDFSAAICHNRLMPVIPPGDRHPFAPLAEALRAAAKYQTNV